MWDWRRTIAWGRCTPLTIVDQFGIKISGFTPSFEALGRLLKKKKKKKNIIMMTKIRISHNMSDFSCGETKVRNDPQGVPMAREMSVSDVCEVLAGRFAASYKALFMHLT